ncbi:hypothetical protein FRX31_030612 [Thalictrum thalictroides]|uniref:Uncharacterized protein n=1 Tax=Thalictrum thalictroides TaxID=46969 RepID=A0A7J6V503_THATH|nr:hypothetical protein FRX31_030612 [Thalictrum thalictroides]
MPKNIRLPSAISSLEKSNLQPKSYPECTAIGSACPSLTHIQDYSVLGMEMGAVLPETRRN